MGRLVGAVKPWLLVIALSVAMGFMAYLHTVKGQRDDARQQQATTQAALDVTAATLAVQVERNQLLVDALVKREEQLNQGAQRIESLRAQANALGVDDADSNEWANQRLPSSVHSWVRVLTRPGDAGANDSSTAGVPD